MIIIKFGTKLFQFEETQLVHDSFENFSGKLEELSGLPLTNQKLISKGIVINEGNFSSLVSQSSTGKTVIRLIGADVDAINQQLKNDDEFKQLERKQLASRAAFHSKRGKRARSGPEFCFRSLRIIESPLLQQQDQAKKLLRRLANDPGILAVMKHYRWNVGCLSEMYPAGKVGISEVCLLGVNKNKGEEISLRIRTDDLQGFRKYLSIKHVLFHELAHMRFSEHNADFFNFMSEIQKTATQLDWTQQAGKSVDDHIEINPNAQHNVYNPSNDTPKFIGRVGRLGGSEGGENRKLSYLKKLEAPVAIFKSNTECSCLDHSVDDHMHEIPINDDVNVKNNKSSAENSTTVNMDDDNNCKQVDVKDIVVDSVNIGRKQVDVVKSVNIDCMLVDVKDKDISILSKTDQKNKQVENNHNKVMINDTMDIDEANVNVNKNENPISSMINDTMYIDEANVNKNENLISISNATNASSGSSSNHNSNDELFFDTSLEQKAIEKIQTSLIRFYDKNELTVAVQCIKLIHKYICNILNHPNDIKYRKIKKTNKVFNEKINSLNNSSSIFTAIGFKSQDSYLVWSEENDIVLLCIAKQTLEEQISIFT